jgi:hypothetical protein
MKIRRHSSPKEILSRVHDITERCYRAAKSSVIVPAVSTWINRYGAKKSAAFFTIAVDVILKALITSRSPSTPSRDATTFICPVELVAAFRIKSLRTPASFTIRIVS